jgi:3-dehydroquinate dehydratase-2
MRLLAANFGRKSASLYDGREAGPGEGHAVVSAAVKCGVLLRKMAKIGKAAKRSVLVMHGPNLNLLGIREPGVYGRETLAAIDKRLVALGGAAGVRVHCFQSNLEGELIDRVQQAKGEGVDFIVLNPAGYTHTSVALRDALAGVAIPFIEVHMSNIQAREAFRHRSYFSDLAVGTICGLGSRGYDFALEYALSASSKASSRPGR